MVGPHIIGVVACSRSSRCGPIRWRLCCGWPFDAFCALQPDEIRSTEADPRKRQWPHLRVEPHLRVVAVEHHAQVPRSLSLRMLLSRVKILGRAVESVPKENLRDG